MAIKGRNKPRASKPKKMVRRRKTVRPEGVGSAMQRIAPKIMGMAPPRDMPRDKPKSTSLRPKIRPKNVPDIIPRPKPRPSSLRPKIRPTKKSAAGGSLKPVPEGNKGLKKLPTAVRNKMGFMQKGGSCKGMGAATRGGKFSRNG